MKYCREWAMQGDRQVGEGRTKRGREGQRDGRTERGREEERDGAARRELEMRDDGEREMEETMRKCAHPWPRGLMK